MKIPEYSPSNVETLQEATSLQQTRLDEKPTVDSQPNVQTPDSIDLSSVTKILAKAGEMDAVRVDELRRQVANGTYTVDSAALANKLIDSSMSEES